MWICENVLKYRYYVYYVIYVPYPDASAQTLRSGQVWTGVVNNNFLMLKNIVLLFFIFFSISLSAQDKDAPNMASVDVTVTDMKGKLSKGEEIFFRNDKTGRQFTGKSNASGKFGLSLPTGSTYTIRVKGLMDTTKYGVIELPAAPEGVEYTEPFRVNIKFEPARRYTLDRVYFDFGKATLRTDSYPALNELLSYLNNKEEVRIEISGHTDNIGKDADNLRLSQQRAEAIRDYLIKKGINATRLVA